MNDFTQISGNIRPDNSALFALKSLLAHIGIKVARPVEDESFFYESDIANLWRRYDNELAFYRSIADSPFHIVYNDGEIDNEIGSQIVYAMLKNRPILMTGKPVFSISLTPMIREILEKRMHYIHSINLPELELAELSLLLAKLKPVDYCLSKGEKVLVNARIKAHFRDLLKESESMRIERARSPIRPTAEV
jgi:hypothetical protein